MLMSDGAWDIALRIHGTHPPTDERLERLVPIAKVYLQDIQQRRMPSCGSIWYLSDCGVQKDVLSAKSNLMLQMLRTQLCRWER